MANRWNIPAWLEQEVLGRDLVCVYCGADFALPTATRGDRPSWEHIVNDARIVTRENTVRCCMACKRKQGRESTGFSAPWLSREKPEKPIKSGLSGVMTPAQQLAAMLFPENGQAERG
jgi:hypothetical protein